MSRRLIPADDEYWGREPWGDDPCSHDCDESCYDGNGAWCCGHEHGVACGGAG